MANETENFLKLFAQGSAPTGPAGPQVSTSADVSKAVPNSVEDFLSTHARGASIPQPPPQAQNQLPPLSNYVDMPIYGSKEDKPFDYSDYKSYLPDPNSVVGRFAANTPANLGKVGTETLHGLTHPQDILEGLRSIGSGAIETAREKLGYPESTATPIGARGKRLTPEEYSARNKQDKEAFGQMAQGVEDFLTVPGYAKREFAEKPMETLMAISPFAGAGSKALSLGAKVLPEGVAASGANIASKGLDIASKANPIDLGMMGASKAAELGLTYGVSPFSKFFSVPGESIPQAYIAGREGSWRYPAQYFGLQGDESIFNYAKSGLDRMFKEKDADWVKLQKKLDDVSSKGERLDYQPMLDRIAQEYGSSVDPKMGARNFSYDQIELLDKMSSEIRERSMRDPQQYSLAHTASDMDDFKRLFTTTFEHKADKLGLSHVYNDIRRNMVNQIKDVAPFYSDAMSTYGQQKAQITDILRGLKLGGQDKEAALQKLFQKTDRTKSLIDTLSEYSPDLKNAIAGRDLRLAQLPPGINGANRMGGAFVLANPFAWPQAYGAAFYPIGLGMSAAQKAILPGAYYSEHERQGHASGGKVDHKSAEALSDQLVAAFARAKKDEELETKVLLNKPDEMIIDALKEAKKAI